MRIAILIYAMVQAVVFGAGVVLVLATQLAQTVMALMPWVIGLSLLIPRRSHGCWRRWRRRVTRANSTSVTRRAHSKFEPSRPIQSRAVISLS
jgi:hypothetical protein